MTKREIIDMLKKTLESIEDYSELVSGIDINDPLLKVEKYLIKILDYAEQKGTRISKEHKEKIADSINFVVAYISEGSAKYFKDNSNKSDYIEQVKEKAEKTYGFFKVISPVNNDIVKIAKVPFLIWACGDTPYQHGQEKGDLIWDLREQLINIWGDTISCSGEKMRNDNVYHSEWIRSMGINPDNFYSLVKEKDKKWINDFAFSFSQDFILFEIEEEGFSIENFLNEINNIIEDLPDNFQMTQSLFNRIKKSDISKNNNNTFQSIPYNVNPNSNFPIYFHPLSEKVGNIEDFIKTTCVIVENSDESVNEIALEFCDYNNSIIFTRNASKTAHLINISKDLQLNIFHLPSDIELNDYQIYRLDKDGKITLIADKEFQIPGITLQNCENDKNFYNQEISKKVSNLAKCYNNGINVPSGFFSKSKEPVKIFDSIQMIARSAGSSENGKKASFSGIFKSNVLDLNSLDNNYSKIQEVIDSFHSPVVKKYADKMNVEVPEIGIFYQEFIKADNSFVIKLNGKQLYIEQTSGAAEKLVNGTAKEIQCYDFEDLDFIDKDFKLYDLVKMIKNVSNILNIDILEFEIVEKEDIYYLIQVV